MSIPFQNREEACYRFISSGFKLEDTVAWMMKEWKDDPTISRAKYPEKLCANTITMGGNGDQQQLNVAAFGNAYRRYASETEAQMTEKSRAEVTKLNSDYQALRERFDQSQRDLNESNNAIQRHLATINRLDRENTIYQLQAGAATEAETPAEVAT
jgi:hypothetical protein